MNDTYISQFISDVLAAYTRLLAAGLPITFFIGAVNVALNIMISAAFGGKLRIGRGE